MKKNYILLLFISAFSAVIYSSCDNRPNVIGLWQGDVPENVSGMASANLTNTMEFGQDGSFQSTYLIHVSKPMAQTDSIISPYEISVSGTATISGTWQYVDREDDEIAITLNPSTLQVQVDPDAVVMQANLISDEQAPVMDNIKASTAEKYKVLFSDMIISKGTKLHLDDVKVKAPLLEFEINDHDYVYHAVANQ